MISHLVFFMIRDKFFDKILSHFAVSCDVMTSYFSLSLFLLWVWQNLLSIRLRHFIFESSLRMNISTYFYQNIIVVISIFNPGGHYIHS